ncbi:sigma-70 family RNA polymerase sigma factor [Spongiibacter sp. KMU-158]|uniref:Sigma-70 family RNA polymerase sigma factor n=2 Tax=Spongiibacter pelagi TaxID=2760804 RepID=A0A927GW40_9GAMM|nr:sigma-70 family RNA polymerase sigma factor [Spongiibacter pelagi]
MDTIDISFGSPLQPFRFSQYRKTASKPLRQNQTEAQLISRLQAGDNQAFATLIARYHQKFLIIARSIIGDVFAEDVVQEAWASIHRAIGNFEGRSSLSTWMIQIVSNEARSRLRREKRHISVEEIETVKLADNDPRFDERGHWQQSPPHWDIATPELMLQEDQLRRCLEHCLSNLPEQQKAVFLLREIEQFDLDNIAAMLALSSGNIRVLLHRARLRLLDIVNHYQETGEC